MRTIDIHAAQPVGNTKQPEIMLRIAAPVPDYKTLGEAQNAYEFEGEELCHALQKTLPGGTLDALLIALLQLKASLLRVAVEPRRAIQTTLPNKPGFYWWREDAEKSWRMVVVRDFGDDRLPITMAAYDVENGEFGGVSMKNWALMKPIGEWIALEKPAV